MIVLVDMDDVLERFVVGWVAYNNEKFGLSVKPEEVKDWDMSKPYPPEFKSLVYDAEKDDRLWDYMEPMPGADEALRKIIDAGNEVYIVTSTYYQTLRAKMERVLFRFYPYIDWSHVIVTCNKTLIKGDVLIDDGPHNFRGGEYRKILFTANHNRNFDAASLGAVRAENWQEACRLVLEMQAEGAL